MKGGALASVFTISGASAVGQLVGLLAIPLISRIFSPAEFGIYSSILAIAYVVSPFSTLKLDSAIPLPRAPGDAVVLLRLSVGVATVVGLGLCGLSVIFIALVGVSDAASSSLLWVAPLSGAGLGIVGATVQFLLREGKFWGIALRNVAQPTLLLLFQVAFGLASVSGGLVFGLLAANTLAALLMVLTLGRGTLKRPSGYTFADTRRLVSRYRQFVMANAPASFISAVGLQAPVVLVTGLYGSETGGSFGMAQRVLAVPMLMVGIAVGQVYLSSLSEKLRSGVADFRPIFYKHSLVLAGCGLSVGFIVAVTAPWAFKLVLGSEWVEAGRFAQSLAIAVGLQLVASPLTQTLVALERLRLLLLLDVFRLSLTLAGCCVPYVLNKSGSEAVTFLAVSMGLGYAAYWIGARKAVVDHRARHRTGERHDGTASSVGFV